MILSDTCTVLALQLGRIVLGLSFCFVCFFCIFLFVCGDSKYRFEQELLRSIHEALPLDRIRGRTPPQHDPESRHRFANPQRVQQVMRSLGMVSVFVPPCGVDMDNVNNFGECCHTVACRENGHTRREMSATAKSRHLGWLDS